MEHRHGAFGLLDLAIVVLTLVTAGIHGVLAVQDGRVPFYLNALGYLVLLAALYVPAARLAGRRTTIRWVFLAYTAVTIVLWIARGDRTPVAYVDKVVEVALLALLWVRRPAPLDASSAASGQTRAVA